MRIDFKHFTVPTGINGLHKQTGDARESTMVNGMRAHALAMKIYKSDGAVEYTDDEVRLMKGLAERYCTPAFIDGLRAQIQEGGGDESGV